MDGHRPHVRPAAVALLCLCAALLHSHGARSAAPATAAAAAQEPEGVVFNDTASTYTVHRVPKRSLDEVMKSLALWRHQMLADDSTADYSAEDGILSMECSACGLTRPSAIDIATIDLESVVAYEAGSWHIGIRSKDGAQDFFGVLRGELGPEPHDPARTSDDRRIALTALADLYDLAYLTQNPQAQSAAAPTAPAKGGKRPSVAAPTASSKLVATSLATLAANADIEGIQALKRRKGNTRDVAQALETAYATRSRAQMLQGQADEALQTLNVGRQSFGKSAALRDREAHYVVIGDAYDRMRLAVKLDVAEMRGYLQRIQTLEPDDATSIEQMLVRVLSNRIADQRAVGRQTIADELVSSGRELFPAWAEQLTQGVPGALPQAGVEAGTVATPPAHESLR